MPTQVHVGKPTRFACSFCGRGDEQVRKLLAGANGGYICDECVSACNAILKQEGSDASQE